MEINVDVPDLGQALQSSPPAIVGSVPSWWPQDPRCKLSYVGRDGTEYFYQEVTFSPGMPNPQEVGTKLNCPPRAGLTAQQQQIQRQKVENSYEAHQRAEWDKWRTGLRQKQAFERYFPSTH